MIARTTLLLLGLLLFASQAVSADEWYRWVDSEGRAIISRKPPPSGAQQRYRATPSTRRRAVNGPAELRTFTNCPSGVVYHELVPQMRRSPGLS